MSLKPSLQSLLKQLVQSFELGVSTLDINTMMMFFLGGIRLIHYSFRENMNTVHCTMFMFG